MRLVCPSCAAEYEVDDTAIPPEGRDVQCSNCGHTWLQYPEGWKEDASDDTLEAESGEAEVSTEEDEAEEATPEDEQELEPEPEEAAPQIMPGPDGDGSETAARPEQEDATWDDGPEGTVDAGGEAPTPPESMETVVEEAPAQRRRPPLDPAVIAILREEAEREARARKQERAGAVLETQTDLGLPQPESAVRPLESPPRGQEARREPPPHRVGVPESQRGRNRLPDIDEFGADLPPPAEQRSRPPRPVREKADDATDPVRSGFRSGFMLSILVVAVLTGIYLLSAPLADALPAAKPALAAYAEGVDRARLWLDAVARAATQNASALISRLRS